MVFCPLYPPKRRSRDPWHDLVPKPGGLARFVPKAVRLPLPVPSDPESSACALPRVRFGFVGHTFERSIVGFLVSLGLLRLGLICLLLMFVTAAAHALRAGADRR